MQPIGSVTKTGDIFNGTLKTMLHTVKIRLVPIEDATEQGPDYRLYTGAAEIGAGWKKTSAAGQDYISLKLDDPAFANPIYASLFPTDDPDTYTLLWSRPKAS